MSAPYVVAVTGASGAIYGLRLVKALAESRHDLILTISEPASLVMKEELGVTLADLNEASCLTSLFDDACLSRIRYYHYKDLLAPIASGSFQTQGMVIAPCSASTLSQIAHGASRNLIERAADATIKEGRRLVLVPRETPLSAIHLDNMLTLARLGVRIVPASPGFYHGPVTVDDLINFVVGKTLDALGVEHHLYQRWSGSHAGTVERITV